MSTEHTSERYRSSSRKLVTLSLKRKIELIQCVESGGKRKKEIASDFGIAPNTLSTILRDKDRYQRLFYGGKTDLNKKRARGAVHEDVDEALLAWFTCARSDNVPLSGPILMGKAEELAKKLGKPDWSCSVGWLDRFKKRHSIACKSMSGERAAVDEETTDSWKAEVLHSILSKYHPRDVFNADETGIFWRLLPDKTLAFRHEKCHGGKKSKERVTAMVCANMDGTEKMPLLVIGKFKNPRCFKRIRKLPVDYEANKRAWMTRELFIKWVRPFDARMSKAKRKVLLVVDNCSSHINIPDLKATEFLFLPPNATAKLQPCDCGIIKNFKSHYRSLMLRKLLQHIESGMRPGEFSINLLDSVMLLEQAWNLVTMTTVKNCFRKAGFYTDDNSDVETEDANIRPLVRELIDRGVIDASLTEDEFIEVDSELSVSPGLPTASEIIGSLQSSEKTGNPLHIESEEDDCGDELPPVSHYEASNCLQKLRVFVAQRDGDSDLLEKLNKLERQIDVFAMENRFQPTLESFFSASTVGRSGCM